MKKIRVLISFLCLTALLMALSEPAKAADTSVTAGSHSVDAAVTLSENKQLLATSKAVILYELNSDTMVYAWNPDDKIYPASMVKLMTAVVALENGNMSDTVTVTRSALSNFVPGSVSANLKRDEVLTLEDLLYCLMTHSANDAALVIAEHIAGSQDAFIQLMNDKASQIGCTGTHYSNTHGLHHEQTYTTARDIARLLEYALENPQFEALFTAESYTVPATNKSEARQLNSTNHMMTKAETSKYFDERVTGGKTGSTDAAGRCLAVTAEANGMKLLAIVMGAVPTYEMEGIILNTYGSFEEMKQLLDFGCEGFSYRQIFNIDKALAQYPVDGGANHAIARPVTPLSTVLPVDVDESLLSWTYGDAAPLTAPVKAGQHITSVQVWYGSVCLAQTELVAMNDVQINQPPAEPQEDDTEENALFVIWWIIGILLVLALILFAVRGYNKAKKKRRHARRMRNRQRYR